LKAFVESLTDKKIEVLITHNHRDHAGNAPLFDKIHMSYIDYQIGKITRPQLSKASRLQYANHIRETHNDKIYEWTEDDIQEFDASDEPKVVEIDDGFEFDLGQRKVTCYLCPGHTPGSLVAIDSQTHYLFCGDCCNKKFGIGVRKLDNPKMNCVSVEETLIALKRIWSKEFDHAMIFNGHADYRNVGEPLETYVYPTLMDGLEKIMKGDCVICKEWIQVIDTLVETAVFRDIRIQFHSDNIFSRKKAEGDGI
jgi:glyoxylase-like metal-dependent hydrolase (beta-lactamase superfamily II)